MTSFGSSPLSAHCRMGISKIESTRPFSCRHASALVRHRFDIDGGMYHHWALRLTGVFFRRESKETRQLSSPADRAIGNQQRGRACAQQLLPTPQAPRAGWHLAAWTSDFYSELLRPRHATPDPGLSTSSTDHTTDDECLLYLNAPHRHPLPGRSGFDVLSAQSP